MSGNCAAPQTSAVTLMIAAVRRFMIGYFADFRRYGFQSASRYRPASYYGQSASRSSMSRIPLGRFSRRQGSQSSPMPHEASPSEFISASGDVKTLQARLWRNFEDGLAISTG